jgi:hypothetical protein
MKTFEIKTHYFQFESDFADNLRCIPMIVRYKLDTCRIKLQLSDWVKLNFQEKDELAELACSLPGEVEHYADYVNGLAIKYTGLIPNVLKNVNETWVYTQQVPEEVISKAREWECPDITVSQWQNLKLLERFALVKLSRSGHEGKNFPRAFQEFKLTENQFIEQPAF